MGVSRQGAKYIYNSAINKLRRNPELLQYFKDSLNENPEEKIDREIYL